MKSDLLCYFLLLVVCASTIAGQVTAAQTENVLFLISGNRVLPATIEVDRALTETLTRSTDRDIALFVEFLDRPTFIGDAFERTLRTYLREKYVDHAPEVIVAGGQPALEFMLRHREELFPHVPVVYLAVDRLQVDSIGPLPPDVVGVALEFDFAGSVELALSLHPNARRLVVVTGASAGDRAWESEIRASLAGRTANLEVLYLSGLTTDALLDRLQNLGAADVVFTPGYFKDGAGVEFAPREAATLMAAASGAPVYGPFSTFIGTGVVGGRMPTYTAMGQEAATLALALLEGAQPETLASRPKLPARAQIDWRQVGKWGIAAEELPEDTVLHFQQPTFWEAYRDVVLIVLVVIVLQTALIAALLIERRLRRRTASRLAESEKSLNLAARAARLSTWVWDVGPHKVGATTPSLEHPSEAQTFPIARIVEAVHPADRERFNRAVRRAVENDEELDIEYRTLLADGEVRWIAARGRVANGTRERLAGVALDVTPRKAAELQAEQDRTALTHIARVSMLGQLSASIAHQLNQPLAAILGNAEAARKMLERSPLDVAELKDICDEIVTEDNRAAEVIRRLGALYKRGELELQPLDLNELVEETLGLVRTELVTRQVLPVTELAPGLPAIEGGRVQLQQVLLNLLLNAADAMRDVEVAQRALRVRTELAGDCVRLSVIDQGTGVAAHDLDKVFEAFWGTKADGIGVGLAICSSIVTAHQGTLTAANNPESGATFVVTLPVQGARSG